MNVESTRLKIKASSAREGNVLEEEKFERFEKRANRKCFKAIEKLKR